MDNSGATGQSCHYLFTEFSKSLKLILDEVTNNNTLQTELIDEQTSLAQFWTRLISCAKAISIDVTKLRLAYSNPPLPTENECTPMINSLKHSVIVLVSTYHSLPLTRGYTLRQTIKEEVVSTLKAVMNLIELLRSYGSAGGDIEVIQKSLHTTGMVWEFCKNFEDLPRSNKMATIMNFTSCRRLIVDAIEEISESLTATQKQEGQGDDVTNDSDDDDNSCKWSQDERNIVFQALGLAKVASSAIKKLIEATERLDDANQESTAMFQLDELATSVAKISPVIDDLVYELYSPIDPVALKDKAMILADLLRAVLTRCRQSCRVIEVIDVKWIDFLEGAIDHNLNGILVGCPTIP